jgi:Ser/Thr protein kinase RdoA (MazF antagonist)
LTNNAVFEVRSRETGPRLVLRIHRPAFRTIEQSRSELEFLERAHVGLDGTRVTVPRPVRTRSGDLVVEADATRHCDLLTWVDGRVLRPGRGLGPRGAHDLGEALGRLHAFADVFQPPDGFELPRWDADGMFTPASPFRPGRLDEVLSPQDLRLFREVEERTRATFAALDRKGGAVGIVHFDFILLNCHLVRRADGWRVGVIDFDDLGWGYFLYDLCPLLGNLAEFPGYATLGPAFLAGYRSVRRLPRDLEVHLPVLMAARHAAACVWLLGLHRTTGSGPPLAEHVAYRMDQIRDCLALGDGG